MQNLTKIIIYGFIGIIILASLFAAYAYVNNKNITGNSIVESSNTDNIDLETITLAVNIPCSGHAGLIKYELEKVGISNVKFSMPNEFRISYDKSKISKEQILALDIFKEYPANLI